MRWLIHCKTDTIRKSELNLPCSVLVWDNYIILKVCNWKITSKATLVFSGKIDLYFLIEISSEMQLVFARILFYPPSLHPLLIFAAQGLIISLECMKLCISLLGWSLKTWYFLVSWEILYKWWVTSWKWPVEILSTRHRHVKTITSRM